MRIHAVQLRIKSLGILRMYTTEDLSLFIKVVDLGNFSNAAKQLNISTATISRQIKTLEDNLGVNLIIRDNRLFELSNAGRELYNEIKGDLIQLKAMTDSLNQRVNNKFGIVSEPSGKLRVILPPSLSFDIISEELPKFVKKYPKVNLSVSYNIKAESIDDGVDYAISNLLPTQVNYLVKHLATVRYKLYCSKQYVESYGIPQSIEDLQQHLTPGSNISLIGTDGNTVRRNVIVSHDQTNAEYILPMPESLTTNNMLHNIKFILSHETICVLTKYAVDFLAARLELVAVLPEYTFGENKFYSIRHPHNNDKAVKAFALFIENIFKTYDLIGGG